MTIPTPTATTIASDAAELLAPVPELTLVVDEPTERIGSCWIPVACSALVVGASLFAAPTLTDSLTARPISDATLHLSRAYRVLAPICDTLDAISLFSLGQHLAFLATCALVFTSWRVFLSQNSRRRLRKRDELTAASQALLVVLSIYVGGALLPRPITRLAMSSPDAVVVDFHSHTRYSWDGRSDFSPEESRRWHHASGFDVAYITDHGTFAGAEAAARNNPPRAGDATVMLSGIEVRDRGNHLVVLGTDAADWQSYTAGDLHERIFERETASRGAARPVALFTLPGNLKSESAMAVDGIELSDAAPRGLAESDRERAEIVALAHGQKKSLVASSNNHGWASASPAWSVMQIHGWRAMTPAQLDVAIREQILDRGLSAVEVIDRRVVGPTSFIGLSLTVPAAAWRILQTMSWSERISWLIWIWLGYAAVVRVEKFRRREKRDAQQQSKFRTFTRWLRAAQIA